MNSSLNKLTLAGLVLLAMGAIYFAFLKPADPSMPTHEPLAAGNESIYISSMRDLQGSPVAMDEEKLVFVNVWATWCGPCNMEMPGIQSLYNKYKNHEKMAFYIISDEDPDTVSPFIARKGYQLPFYQFTGPYPAALDGNAIPRTYIIYKGEILAQATGASHWDRPEIIELIEKKLSEI
jgi:thiol-disulfide isomerase/thioredoxin